VVGRPSPVLAGKVSGYYGFRETKPEPVRRREGPRRDVVLIVSFGEEWTIDGERFTSFAAGLHDRQVTTEHGGRSFGMHIDLAPPAAYTLFGLPLHTLARRKVPLEEVVDEPFLVERLHDEHDWGGRFRLLDEVLARRLAAGRPASAGVTWAWQRLFETGGRVRVGTLAEQLGWSRKRIVTRFREEVGLPPKAAARLLRFERARALAERTQRPDWVRIAAECGYYDQSHLINEFRAVTGLTPATFFQDTVAPAA
jgi:AraC-like DNA-binding protein